MFSVISNSLVSMKSQINRLPAAKVLVVTVALAALSLLARALYRASPPSSLSSSALRTASSSLIALPNPKTANRNDLGDHLEALFQHFKGNAPRDSQGTLHLARLLEMYADYVLLTVQNQDQKKRLLACAIELRTQALQRRSNVALQQCILQARSLMTVQPNFLQLSFDGVVLKDRSDKQALLELAERMVLCFRGTTYVEPSLTNLLDSLADAAKETRVAWLLHLYDIDQLTTLEVAAALKQEGKWEDTLVNYQYFTAFLKKERGNKEGVLTAISKGQSFKRLPNTFAVAKILLDFAFAASHAGCEISKQVARTHLQAALERCDFSPEAQNFYQRAANLKGILGENKKTCEDLGRQIADNYPKLFPQQ